MEINIFLNLMPWVHIYTQKNDNISCHHNLCPCMSSLELFHVSKTDHIALPFSFIARVCHLLSVLTVSCHSPKIFPYTYFHYFHIIMSVFPVFVWDGNTFFISKFSIINLKVWFCWQSSSSLLPNSTSTMVEFCLIQQ